MMEKTNGNVQVIRLGNAEFAVIPLAEYERLRNGPDEDAIMVERANAARGEETFPAEVAARLVAGEAALKVIREWRQMSQTELGKRAKVAAQYISQIERKARNMGRATASKLAPVLKVSMDVLLDGQANDKN